ncbi:phosphatase PAP2 family protein [Streptomyces sp. NPDC005811]|uniref:phosphatase PAP2 family protein n=1 Tax=Streptomyces sp. NPDC005811 TaxID=3154565 RepID=UPI0033DEA752
MTFLGLLVFAVLMLAGWWRAGHKDAVAAMTTLAVPATGSAAYGVDALAELPVCEDRPCRSPAVRTPEARPAHGARSFPSNHAAAAAVALLFVSRRPGAVAAAAALARAASRVWIGVHHPHDAIAGLLLGGAAAPGLMILIRRRARTVARLLTGTRLSPLLAVS